MIFLARASYPAAPTDLHSCAPEQLCVIPSGALLSAPRRLNRNMINFFSTFRQRAPLSRRALLIAAGAVLAFAAYAADATGNPPGFYLDESSIAFNAHSIAVRGVDEHKVVWPLYFRAFGEYKNPVYIYLLALIFKLAGPSIFAARLLSETAGFLAALLLGLLAARVSRRVGVGLLVTLTALFTPWLFELSRLVFEVALYPLALVGFLFALWRAHERGRWTLIDSLSLAATLGLLTYTYSIGRVHAPLLALGLIFFVRRAGWRGLALTWACYGVALVPLFVFNAWHPEALSSRFYLISYIKPNSALSDIARGFAEHYLLNLNPARLLVTGELNIRHHIPTMGSLLAATFALAILGVDRIAHRHLNDAWWRYALYGLAVSLVPAALTRDEFHSLRLIGVPVFVLLLTVPALTWLWEDERRNSARRITLLVLLALTFVQAAVFQYQFHRDGPRRGNAFEEVYPQIFQTALQTGARPIYLQDRGIFPGYIHGYWYGALNGLDQTQFVHLDERAEPPNGSVVVGTIEKCQNCQVLAKQGDYIVFRAASDGR
ncbi:MAG: hypothetical protein ACRD9R_03540 [Pyrinomonadaceae bacterium]